MLLATATVLHRVYTFDSSISATVGWGVLLSAALSAFSYWHCVTDEIVMHSITFGKFPERRSCGRHILKIKKYVHCFQQIAEVMTNEN